MGVAIALTLVACSSPEANYISKGDAACDALARLSVAQVSADGSGSRPRKNATPPWAFTKSCPVISLLDLVGMQTVRSIKLTVPSTVSTRAVDPANLGVLVRKETRDHVLKLVAR